MTRKLVGSRAYSEYPVMQIPSGIEAPTRRFDAPKYRENLETDRYDEALEAIDEGKIPVWKDPAGSGKTTTGSLAAESRGRAQSMLPQTHEKARDQVVSGKTPHYDLHLKGAAKPREDACMDEECDHADGECPSMCPVYDLGENDSFRRLYESLLSIMPPIRAHQKLRLNSDNEHEWHDDCAWLDQFSDLESAETVAGVHEYQLLKGVRETEQVGERDILIDESPRTLGDRSEISIPGLSTASERLRKFADLTGTGDENHYKRHNAKELADLADRLRAALSSDTEIGDDLGEIDPPEIEAATEEIEVAVGERRPGDTTIRELDTHNAGFPPYDGNDQRIPTDDVYIVERQRVVDTLARLKTAYNEWAIGKLTREEWQEGIFPINALLAAASSTVRSKYEIRSAEHDPRAYRAAIAVPNTLDTCPHCGTETNELQDGARACPNDGGEESEPCGWFEPKNPVGSAQHYENPARVVAWATDHDAVEIDERALVTQTLSDLDHINPIVLDATASEGKIAGLYDRSREDVEISGDETFNAGIDVTQVLSGAYFESTVRNSETHREKLQTVIDRACEKYERPLFGAKKKVLADLDFPENAETRYFGNNRGVNMGDCDAAIVLNAPHPHPRDIKREARLLAMDRPDLRAGGTEYSLRTEDGEAAEGRGPPIYRRLRYQADDGTGVAVPTKGYSGLAGELFDEAVRDEIEQFVHRTRGLLKDPDSEEAVDVILCTNVPTNIPIDNVVTSVGDLFQDVQDLFKSATGLPTGATDLLTQLGMDLKEDEESNGLGDLNTTGDDGPEAIEAIEVDSEAGEISLTKKELTEYARRAGIETREGQPPTEETVGEWVDSFRALGLLEQGEYRFRRGKVSIAEISYYKTAAITLYYCGDLIVQNSELTAPKLAERIKSSKNAEWAEWLAGLVDRHSGTQAPRISDRSPGIEEPRAETDGGAQVIGLDTAAIESNAAASTTVSEHRTDQIERLETMGEIYRGVVSD